MDRHRLPLELTREEREALLRKISAFVQEHLDGLETAPAKGPIGAAGNRLAELLSVDLGEEPLSGGMDHILKILNTAVGASLTTPGPGYLAYIPGGGIYAAALADFASDCFNRYTGLAAAAPALARLEADVLRWLARQFGYHDEARGIFTSGGSLANFTALFTARATHFTDADDLRLATAYTSDQVHHSVTKAARLTGLPSSNVRMVPVDERLRLRPEALASLVETDRAAGFRPFLVVASAGTTNTGAIDPLPEVADVCAAHGLWLHVDGAYGGAFVLCDEGQRRLRGIERADSITFDPHKGLFLPYGTGCLLVREGSRLAAAHRSDAAYLQELDNEHAPPSPTDLGPELTRDYRGLRLWLPLMLHGARPFREALAEKLELAELCHHALLERIERGAPLEVAAAPQLSVLAFRLRRLPGESLAAWSARNRGLKEAINAYERVHLSGTDLPADGGPVFTLRVCVLSFRTHERHLKRFLEDLDRALVSGP